MHFSNFLKNPASTYDMLTRECRQLVSRADWGVQVAMGIGMLESFYEVDFNDIRVGEVEVRDVDQDSGQAAVTMLDSDGNLVGSADEFTTYLYEDGTWRSTDCGVETDTSSATVDGELLPAGQVEEDRARGKSTDGEVGVAYDFGDLSVEVSSIEYYDDVDDNGTDDDYRIALEVRTENRSTEDTSNPELKVFCADGTDSGWYADSTFEMYGDLPSGSYSEGTLVLGVPLGCSDPVVRASTFAGTGETVDWTIPESAQPR